MNTANLGSNAASVRFENVSKVFGDFTAVKNVSLSIEPGRLVTLLGPSGCGKTTTLRMIAGLEMASSGDIFIGGRNVTNLPATDRDVSMVFQSYALFPHMTVLENVSYGLTFSGFPKPQIRERAMQGLELVGLEKHGSRLPSELSGGQQQRVAVARALVLQPQVLLFDEPLSNLDAKLRRQVREDIRSIQQDLGLTVVYVTHDQEEALAVSDEIIVMRDAEIAQTGSPRELYEAPVNRFVADFIGEANIVSCQIVGVKEEMAEVAVNGHCFSLPSRGLRQGAASLAVRPSRVKLGDTAGIRAEIKKATYVGVRMEYTLEAEFGSMFVVEDDVGAPRNIGDTVFVDLAKTRPVLLPND